MEDFKTLSEAALRLDSRSRARLARALLESLEILSRQELEELWIEEAQNRLEDQRAHKRSTLTTDEVLDQAQRQFG